VLTHDRAPVKSLQELEQWWSLDDLLSANIALDVWDEMERQATEKARREADT